MHADFGAHNLVFEPSTLRVIVVFDFEEAGRAGRHRNFKYLPSFGPAITARVLEGYRDRAG